MSQPLRPRVSLQDVAQRAGVARSTASDALNDRGRVAPATQLRVREAAQHLGYLAHPAARGLRVGRTQLLGVALRMSPGAPNLYPADLYYGLLITACATTASQRGYALVLLPDGAVDVAAELPLAAIIVTDTAAHDPTLEHAYTLGIPVITDYRPHDPRSSVTVDVDVPSAVALVNDHLVDAGAQHIGLLSSSPRDTSFAEQWETNHAKWCAAKGVELRVQRGASSDLDELAAAATRLWNGGCDAIVGCQSGSGPVLLSTAAALGKRVPTDVLVAVVDEDPDLAHLDPPLTSVGLDPVTTAVQGTNLVIDVVEEKVQLPAHLFMPAHLNVRASTQR